jgi:hypothetical protein
VGRVVVVASLMSPGRAQELEPRAYANAPIGLNFLLAGYDFSQGGFASDPSLPVDDVDLDFHGPALGYAYSLGVAGKSAKIAGVVPFGFLSGTATFLGEPASREVSGLLDPRLRFSITSSAPALQREFAAYQQDLIVGASLQVQAPLGQYDPSRLVNLGTNRWAFRPEVGVSKALGALTVELAAAVNIYTDNDDFLGTQTRKQDPLYAVQTHVVRSFASRIWIAFDGTYYEGAAATVDGASISEALSGSRLGLTLSLPIDPRNSVKLAWSGGISARTAADYDAIGVTWQHLWGGGMP